VKTEIAFEEDHWKEFQLGEALFSGVKPCSRCRMINLDPEKLSFSKEPLQTLAKYRKEGKKVKFGLNALWKNEGQMVRVGDEVVSR